MQLKYCWNKLQPRLTRHLKCEGGPSWYDSEIKSEEFCHLAVSGSEDPEFEFQIRHCYDPWYVSAVPLLLFHQSGKHLRPTSPWYSHIMLPCCYFLPDSHAIMSVNVFLYVQDAPSSTISSITLHIYTWVHAMSICYPDTLTNVNMEKYIKCEICLINLHSFFEEMGY